MALVCRTGAYRTHALRVTARRAERQTAKTNPLKYAGREHLYLSPSTPHPHPPPPASVGSRRWDQREEQRRWAERKATESRVRTPQRRQPGSISRLPNVCVRNNHVLWRTVGPIGAPFCCQTVNASQFSQSWNHVHRAWNSVYFLKGSCRLESPVKMFI